MRTHNKNKGLACSNASSASLGAGVSVVPAQGRVITHWTSSQSSLQAQVRDQGGTWRVLMMPNSEQANCSANEGLAVTLSCDTNTRLTSTAGVALTYRYCYWLLS